jgi:hypothetical protein
MSKRTEDHGRIDNIRQGRTNRRRGHDFERWVVRFFKDRGWKASRRDQSRGGEYNPDVKFYEYPLEDFHFELKRLKRQSLLKYWDQASSDAKGREPAVVWKADGYPPMITYALTKFADDARLLYVHEVDLESEGNDEDQEN